MALGPKHHRSHALRGNAAVDALRRITKDNHGQKPLLHHLSG